MYRYNPEPFAELTDKEAQFLKGLKDLLGQRWGGSFTVAQLQKATGIADIATFYAARSGLQRKEYITVKTVDRYTPSHYMVYLDPWRQFTGERSPFDEVGDPGDIAYEYLTMHGSQKDRLMLALLYQFQVCKTLIDAPIDTATLAMRARLPDWIIPSVRDELVRDGFVLYRTEGDKVLYTLVEAVRNDDAAIFDDEEPACEMVYTTAAVADMN